MNIIGVSGLHDSVSFKKAHFPDLDRRQLRIAQGLDSAAALVGDDGIIAAIAEERLTRIKGTGDFPAKAIGYCLEAGALKPGDIDFIAHGFSYEPLENLYRHSELGSKLYDEVLSPAAQTRCIRRFCGEHDWQDKLVQVPHHLAHAASAWYPSGFDEALIMISDGMGEQESATIARGDRDGIEIIAQVPALHSLGILYSVFTLYLGFDFNFDEYKVMGLAPYGNPRRYFNTIMDMVTLRNDGSYTVPVLFENRTDRERETYERTLGIIADRLGPARESSAPLEQRHRDIAAALQSVLQACLLHTLGYYRRETGLDRLCMAGGVALNCSANGVIQRSRLFREIFIQPASGDDGTALGAALHVQHRYRSKSACGRMGLPFWGPEYDHDAIRGELETRDRLEWTCFDSFDKLLKPVVERLDQGQIIGWFQGRGEFGPRALGNRSILANPGVNGMQDRINAMIKKREDFRPFAPAVTADSATRYFDIDSKSVSAYNAMLLVARVRRELRERLPAVTHVDGSARVQTVATNDNPRFWSLLKQFEQLSGLPILLNTSFNVRGQPIVCTPAEAIDTFVSAGLDSLVMGNFLVTRTGAAT